MNTFLRAAAAAVLLTGVFTAQAQTVYQRALNAITAPATSVVLNNTGQVSHTITAYCTAATQDVKNGLQVRMEASLDGQVYFPIGQDITELTYSADMSPAGAYKIERANGTYHSVRVKALAVPNGCPLTVYYSGSAQPLGRVITFEDAGEVNVLDEGAQCNGATDDQSALAAALAKAATEGKPVVRIPRGTCLHSGILDIPNNVTLRCDSWGVTLQATTLTTAAIRFNSATGSGIEGCLIRNTLTPRQTNDGSAGIWVNNSSNIGILNNYIVGAASAGTIITGSTNVRFQNNVTDSTLADGTHATRGSSQVLMDGNLAVNTGDDCFATVSYLGDGVVSKNITITNNICQGSKARGATNIGSDSVIIANNQIISPLGHGINVSYETSYNTYVPNFTIVSGNTIDGVTRPGMNPILVTGAKDTKIRNNIIRGGNPSLIQGNAMYTVFSGNQMRGAQGLKVFTGSSYFTITDNTITDAIGLAIGVSNCSAGEISNNHLQNVQTTNLDAVNGAIDVVSCTDVIGSGNTVWNPDTWTGSSAGPVRVAASTRSYVGAVRNDSFGRTGNGIPVELGGTGTTVKQTGGRVTYTDTDGSFTTSADLTWNQSTKTLSTTGDIALSADKKIYGSGGASYIGLYSGLVNINGPGAVNLFTNSAGTVNFSVGGSYKFTLSSTDLWVNAKFHPSGGNPTITAGNGTPEGAETATPGSIFLSTGGAVYVKASGTGNTGWVLK